MGCRGHGQRRVSRRVFHDVTHTSVARDMFVSCREHGGLPVNQGGTADSIIRPWWSDRSIRDFLLSKKRNKKGGTNMIKPTLEEAKRISTGCAVVPIALEIFSDQKTPIEVLRNIRKQSDNWFILESVNGSDSWGRYTFLGYKPVLNVYGTGDTITVKNGMGETKTNADAVAVIREKI